MLLMVDNIIVVVCVVGVCIFLLGMIYNFGFDVFLCFSEILL